MCSSYTKHVSFIHFTYSQSGISELANILGLIVATDQVVNDVRVSNDFIDGFAVLKVNFERNNLTEITSNLERSDLIRITVGNNDLGTLLGYNRRISMAYIYSYTV